MTTTGEAALDEIDRIHDDDPDRAAAELRSLDTSTLPASRLPLLGFLLLHVLGEKFGQWTEAADRLEALRAVRQDAPMALLAHAAVASTLAGRADGPALAGLASVGGDAEAKLLLALSVLGWRPPDETAELAAQLHRLAAESERFDADGPLSQRLAAGFNNTTSALLDRAQTPTPPDVAAALHAGANAALRFWKAAGAWVNHERALYLRALVANRIGDPAAASADCRQALEIIAGNGSEDVDRAFLRLQLAAALLRLGQVAEGRAVLAEAEAAAAAWDDAGLKSWFKEEHDRLFSTGEQH